MVTIRRLTLEGHLKEIYDEERNRLELGDTKIRLFKASRPDRSLPFRELVMELWIATPSVRLRNRRYEFLMTEEMLENEKRFRSCTRHELYHIYKGHFDNGVTLLKNLVYDVPTMLYQYTGLRTF